MPAPRPSRLGRIVDAPPLNARSVILSTLLGTDPPRMSARRLVRVGALFDISEGTIRTSLSRMAARGELTPEGDGRYRLAGPLLDRAERQAASRVAQQVPWNGRWRAAIVVGDGRPAPQRAATRAAARALRLAEWREGVWARPDNLPPDRQPDARATLAGHCRWISFHPDGDDAELAAGLWDLDGWAEGARTLRRGMATFLDRLEAGDHRALAPGFVAAASVLRHLQADPLLPVELLPRHWPGPRLRADYERYEPAVRALLADWFDAEPVGG